MSRLFAATCAVLLTVALAGAAAPAAAAPGDLAGLQRERHTVQSFLRSQGLGSDPAAPGPTVYSSTFTLERADAGGGSEAFVWGLPLQELIDGFNHVGDIDVHAGRVLAPFEGGEAGDGTPLKGWGVFDARTLTHLRTARHVVVGDELPNNSWASVAPAGDFFAAGEWETMTRFLVFPTEGVLTGAVTQDLQIAAEIHLDAPVVDVQGCDFATPTRLFCFSDDAPAGYPVFTVDLERPLDGADVDGTVTVLGEGPIDVAVPWLAPLCTFGHEAEGVDVVGDVYRLIVVDPCVLWMHHYTYRAG